MAKGPKGKRRLAVNARAAMIAKIATCEVETRRRMTARIPRCLGRMGGQTRAKAMSAKRRKEIASKAANERRRNESGGASGRHRTRDSGRGYCGFSLAERGEDNAGGDQCNAGRMVEMEALAQEQHG